MPAYVKSVAARSFARVGPVQPHPGVASYSLISFSAPSCCGVFSGVVGAAVCSLPQPAPRARAAASRAEVRNATEDQTPPVGASKPTRRSPTRRRPSAANASANESTIMTVAIGISVCVFSGNFSPEYR